MNAILLAIALWAGACRTVINRARPLLDDAARYSDDVARGTDDVARLADDAANLTKAEKSLLRKALENHWDDIATEISNRSNDRSLDVLANTDANPAKHHVIRASAKMNTSYLLRIPRYLALDEDDEGNRTLKSLYIAQDNPAILDAMLSVNISQ